MSKVKTQGSSADPLRAKGLIPLPTQKDIKLADIAYGTGG